MREDHVIKVASYCRVSTDTEDQANSFASQQRYFREYIERNPEWVLYKVYADEGITGTSTKKRLQFQQMISDAYDGRFQMIITKEISRFSRNILDTIAYTRELKAMGIAVLFLTDGINTLDADAELRLSIMASIAQEESRRTSGRVTWGQTRQMERGVVFGHSMLGYDVIDGKLFVNPQGAETVQLIFRRYAVEQMSAAEIAELLMKEGYPTSKGSLKWSANTILKILHNEKYVGDLVQKKTYTLDYLTHEKRTNHGEVQKISIKNHHEPIISRELWNLTQDMLSRNNKHSRERHAHSSRFTFSGKIKCGECGASFAARKKYRKDGSVYRFWCCSNACQGKCDVGRLLRDDDAINMVKAAMQRLDMDRNAVISNVTELVLDAMRAGEGSEVETLERLHYEIEQTERKVEAVMDSYFSGSITQKDMQVMKTRYEKLLVNLQEKIAHAGGRGSQKDGACKKGIQDETTAIINCETDSQLLYKILLAHITVFKDRHIELLFNHLEQVFIFT